jgi:tetratricopeptide (TPR) repeat protein
VADRPIDWQRLPARVEGVIETRIHRLDQALQTTLNIASVEGERFTAEVVAQIQGLAEPTLVQQLSRVLDRQHRLVTAQNLERLTPDGQRLSRYRFRHHLFQQYLYQNLDELEKIYLHEAVGNALESFYGDQASRVAAQLAYHFRQAGVAGKTVGYLLQASQQAMGLGAYLEAITQLNQGLELLETMPDNPQHARQELSLQLLLGSALQACKGYSHPEAGRALRRAKTLCDQVRDANQSFHVLWLLGFYYRWQGDLQASHQLGTQLLELALQAENPPQVMLAHWAAGWDLMALGELAAARTHLEQALALDDPEQHRTLAFRFGLDPGVIALAHLASTLWLLGYPEQALARSETALSLARELDHPLSQAFVQIVLIQLAIFLRDFEAVHTRAEMCHRLATEYGLSHLQVVGVFYRGAVLVRRGQVETGLVDIERSIKSLEASRAVAVEPGLVELAAAYGLAGRPEAGLSVLAQVTGGPTGIRCFDAEIHRLRGELLAMQGAAPGEVETHYWQAIQVARQHEARSWELRATVSLARLWQARGKQAEAYKMLAEIYHWFSEGFDTPDLVEARQLLESLAVTEINVNCDQIKPGEPGVVDSSAATAAG